ncbi:unnamed protein product [Cyclocybe aegerita]|uniref:Protein kinase domain-containing protein n=1 Tax=Cyclocybe aegerita TaxID=1973307 RepID=A0A8S0XLE2_CYCAE|nr:unnamed protein product [Cyclocybe aegerita]
MRSHGRNKRSRGNKDPDGDVYMNIQEDDMHSDAYSRSRTSLHPSESYRTATASNRTHYTSERDISSRSRRDEDWRHAEVERERYSYDPYTRGDRAEYDDSGPRSSAGWGTVDSAHYIQPQTDWDPRYELSSSYSESSAWGSTYEGNRQPYVEHWPSRDTGEMPPDDWGTEIARTDQRHDRQHQDWRPEGRRDKNSAHRFQSDSGWDSRRRDKGWSREGNFQRDEQHTDQQYQAVEDRSWEPAASWKSSNRGDHQRGGQNGQRHNQQRSKKGNNNNRQRREWRTDDSDLNNWTRRDATTAAKSTTNQYASRRKHPRSPSRSRSRSRSPAESYRSHRSSRGRSRSPSFSPASKRRRTDSSPITLRSRSPSERSIKRSRNKSKRYYSKSPSPGRTPSRRSSISAASSSGSERSLSRSPVNRTRAPHRLPSANPRNANMSKTKKSNNGVTPRKSSDSRNGKSRAQKHRKAWDTQQAPEPEDDYLERAEHPVEPPSSSISHLTSHNGYDSHPISISMPPPPVPTHSVRGHYERVEYPSPVQVFSKESKIDIQAAKSTRLTKNAGFKPITKTSSALKRFFPGDEEDTDVVQQSSTFSELVHQSDGPLPLPRVPLSSQGKYTETAGDAQGRSGSQEPMPRQSPMLLDPPPPLSCLSPTSNPNQHAPLSNDHQPSSLVAVPDEHEHPTSHSDVQEPSSERRVTPPVNQEDTAPASSSNKDLYKIVSQVGEGTFGKVYKARNTVTGTYFALKRIRMESERDGFPVTAMREIKLLQSLRHMNVVRLYEMMVSNGSVYMVFEYMDHDLTGVLSQTQFTFSDANLKSLCHQMLAGLAYLHHKGVIHRDIKGSNILINNQGELKLADFGLARFYQKRRRSDYTNRVITLWYRPPELLFGATVYGPEVDMWSAGCIMLELFTKKPVFQGVDEIHQVEVIFKLLGSPTPRRWPDVMNLPWFELVKPQQVLPNRFREAFQKWLSPAALDLAEQLLNYNPAERITALQAMEAPYFLQEAPPASLPVGLVDLEGEWHELETKRERAKRKERKV